MALQIITGFHAIEERIRRSTTSVAGANDNSVLALKYSSLGPRIKKILAFAKKAGISVSEADSESLNELVKQLPPVAREHRGLVLIIEGAAPKPLNDVDFDQWLREMSGNKNESSATVLVLDSITDPHNVGAILRSCDQFGVSLVILPERNSPNGISDNEVIARSSAGASAWVPVSVVTNLVRTVKYLKDAGFWIYGADAGGISVADMKFPSRSVIIMGSEGNGISRLLGEQCDSIVSIPTCGRIDSLNVSVAAGILIYEKYRQSVAGSIVQ